MMGWASQEKVKRKKHERMNINNLMVSISERDKLSEGSKGFGNVPCWMFIKISFYNQGKYKMI